MVKLWRKDICAKDYHHWRQSNFLICWFFIRMRMTFPCSPSRCCRFELPPASLETYKFFHTAGGRCCPRSSRRLLRRRWTDYTIESRPLSRSAMSVVVGVVVCLTVVHIGPHYFHPHHMERLNISHFHFHLIKILIIINCPLVHLIRFWPLFTS